MSAPEPHPVESSASGQNPAQDLVDGVQQLAINAQQNKDTDPASANEAKQKGQKKERKEKKAKGGDDTAKQPLEFTPTPDFFAHRLALFDKLKKEQDDERAKQDRKEITIALPDGKEKKGTAYETSPMDIAKEISKSLSERIVISKVNGDLWDLERPFEKDSTVEFFDFESPEGKRVFWHSSAHVLGEAAERHYGCHLCIGPPTDEGFFYEMGMGLSQDRSVRPEDFAQLENLIKSAIKDKQKFERVVVSKENLLEMFKYNKYKQHIISSKIADGTSTTVYRCGPMVDLCVGPHIPHTGRIKAMSILKNSASYFLGDQKNDSLQRLYGISFPDTKQMTEYKQFLLEAAKRDHRKIGKDQELFFFNELSPGSCFWLPHGTRIYNTLLEYMKSEYYKRGYTEVISPNMYNSKVWETSGHWQNYKDDMFVLPVEKEQFALKPMNCPGHCLMFGSRDRSYKELPMRYAEFGVIHRNEASGALSGLTRVRRFVQDDAHIFCMSSQIEHEIKLNFDFLQAVYGNFGFTFKLELSTRPEKYIGDLQVWNDAEKRLENALNEFVPGKWQVNPGDGAFYGPKIDITISDAMKREFQCATIQLDFNLPNRFNLKFRTATDAEGQEFERPVMIHRAVLGSLERFIAICTEHFAGKWPFWMSPRQIIVIPVTQSVYGYAEEVQRRFHDQGFFTDADLTSETLKKKVLRAETGGYNFIFIVGHEEQEKRAVNVRNGHATSATKGREEVISLDDVSRRLQNLKESKKIENEL